MKPAYMLSTLADSFVWTVTGSNHDYDRDAMVAALVERVGADRRFQLRTAAAAGCCSDREKFAREYFPDRKTLTTAEAVAWLDDHKSHHWAHYVLMTLAYALVRDHCKGVPGRLAGLHHRGSMWRQFLSELEAEGKELVRAGAAARVAAARAARLAEVERLEAANKAAQREANRALFRAWEQGEFLNSDYSTAARFASSQQRETQYASLAR